MNPPNSKAFSRTIYCALLVVIFCIFTAIIKADDISSPLPISSLFEKSETIKGSELNFPHQLSFRYIIPGTDLVLIDDLPKTREIDYSIDYNLSQLTIKADIQPESLIKIKYQIIPLSINQTYQRQLFKPLETPYPEMEEKLTPSLTRESQPTLNYSGSKTVSVSMESLRGLTINQPTRINVSGNVTENIRVTAMLSDENLPLQPEGTTEELKDLDRILIKVEGKHLSATLGDYEAGFDETEFVLFPKMLEGAQAQGEFDIGGFTLLGAVSKGQSSSITIQGIEGQNEYRISVDGKYIIVIAGSETVWLNGEKMRRGEENDYIVKDYGDPTVEFTKKHIITRRDIIVVDFEYLEEELNYPKDLYAVRGKVNIPLANGNLRKFSKRPITLGVSYAIESDDKDKPLLLLSNEDIANLKNNRLDPDGDGRKLPAPMEHSALGFDSSLNLGQIVNLKGEIAFSKRDLNTFSIYDDIEEGKAWKISGFSSFNKIRINLDLRHLDADFIPVGSTLSSRTRVTYQEDYKDKAFRETQPLTPSIPSAETSYDIGLWFEPLKYVELKGDLGRTSNKYDGSGERLANHWSRSLKIAFPELPKVSNRYQEVTTEVDGEENTKKTREIWEINHQFWEKVQIGAKNEEIKQINELSNDNNRMTWERQLTFQIPELKKISISSKYSLEEESRIQNPESRISSAYTFSTDLMFKPKTWLDFSGYFARRQFNRMGIDETIPASSTTNLADFKLNIRPLRINYQIDKKLSSKQEEVYVNYFITIVDGREERRYLLPGEGNYVKIDEFTYREDSEKGEYIRLVRTVGDIPVTSVALQAVFSFQPRILFPSRQGTESHFIIGLLTNYLSIFEAGIRINEEQESATRGFYFLREIQTDKTVYGLNRYWIRTQLSPAKWLLLMGNWEKGNNINKRVNNRFRKLESDRWNMSIESPLKSNFSIGGKWEEDNSYETLINPDESNLNGVISDISEQKISRTVFINYRPAVILSRLKFEGKNETESDKDSLQGKEPVFTKTNSIGSEATWSFRNVGTGITEYRIARGTSTGKLPFARYDFHEGISHRIRLEVDYRIKWFTDLVARLIYRGEIAKDSKPDHRLSVEMTANF